MKAIKFIAEVDERHCLQITSPATVLPGQVRVMVLTPEPEEDAAGNAWMNGISHEWKELLDAREDIYTLEDGKPAHAAGLKVPSLLRLHKVATIHSSSVQRFLGTLSPVTLQEVDTKLRALLSL